MAEETDHSTMTVATETVIEMVIEMTVDQEETDHLTTTVATEMGIETLAEITIEIMTEITTDLMVIIVRVVRSHLEMVEKVA